MKNEKDIEQQMERAIKKIPFEIKKIKFVLFFVKIWKSIKFKIWRGF